MMRMIFLAVLMFSYVGPAQADSPESRKAIASCTHLLGGEAPYLCVEFFNLPTDELGLWESTCGGNVWAESFCSHLNAVGTCMSISSDNDIAVRAVSYAPYYDTERAQLNCEVDAGIFIPVKE